MFMATWAGSCLASMGAWLGCSAASCCTQHVMRVSARFAYCLLFTLAMALAWIMRDYGQPLMERIPWVVKQYTGEPSDAFFGIQAVYRISFGNFLFFLTLSLALLGVRTKGDRRAQFLMSGSPAVKLGLWLLFNGLPFLLPNSAVLAYGYVARVASAGFLILQLFLLLDFVLTLNERWVAAAEEDARHYKGMLAATAACYAACLVLVGLLFAWFKPSGAGSCSFNVAVISGTVLLFLAFTVVSVSPAVPSGSLFPSAVIALYTVYLAYGALQSEPHSEACNGLGHEIDAASGSALAVGMLLMLISVVYSAFKAGSNTTSFTLDSGSEADEAEALLEAGVATSAGLDGEAAPPAGAAAMQRPAASRGAVDDSDKPVTYNHSFFHLVFALASAYIAMLLTGWGAVAQDRGLMDVGWASVAMKLVTQWATGLLYMWVLIAPGVLSGRTFA